MLRVLCSLVLCLFLAGCVLQSRTALFAEGDAQPLLKAYGKTFTVFNFTGGTWKKEDDQITFEPAGRHYVVKDGKAEMQVVFAPLGKGWWAMQAEDAEKKESFAYMLVEEGKSELLFHPLMCADLKKKPEAANLATFEKDDCFVKPGKAQEQFEALVPLAGPAMMKLVKAP